MTFSTKDRPNEVPWPPIIYIVAGIAAYGMSQLFTEFLAFATMSGEDGLVPGLLISGLGLGLIAWAITTMVRHKANIAPNRAATRLVRDGPFRWSRNPIYLGDTFLLAGLGFMFDNPWFFVAAPMAAIMVHKLAILREESHLASLFGSDWEEYRQATPRWIGPV